MSLKIDSPVSEGIASITASNLATFTFTTGYGNALILACETGGLMRVSVGSAGPNDTIDTEIAGTFMVYCDGGNAVVEFPLLRVSGDVPTVVKVYPYSNVTNMGVTLGMIG